MGETYKGKEETFGDRVKEKIGYQKQILITFPDKVFKRLAQFSKENSCDCYWLAIEKALDVYFDNKDKDLNTIMLMDRDEALKAAINSLDARLTQLETKPVEKEIKKRNFGKVNKNEQ